MSRHRLSLFLLHTCLHIFSHRYLLGKRMPQSVRKEKMPNVYKSCPKMMALEKLKILTHLQKLPKNVGDLGKSFAAKGFEKLRKVQ